MSPHADHTLTKLSGDSDDAGGPRAAAQVYLVMESRSPLAPSMRFGLGDVDELLVGRGATRSVERRVEGGRRQLVLRVNDPFLSSNHARFTQVLDRWTVADAGSKNGSLVNGAATRQQVLTDGDVVELGHTFFLYRAGVTVHGDEPTHGEAGDLTTLIPSLARQFATLARMARSKVSVVVEGPTGSGKEVVARALHDLSGRRGPFIAVNCGALPRTLLEAELFGHRKGAFSGADEERPGLIRAAHEGTLFLDEIGELPEPSQVAFLRVLQEREVVPVGGTRPVAVDLRVVAASHRDLDAMVTAGSLRSDLFGRLCGFRLALPALDDRREDLGLIVAALLRRLAGARAAQISFQPRAARALFFHDWPRNARELEKCLESALVLASDGVITLAQLPGAMQSSLNPDGAPAPEPEPAADAQEAADDLRRRDQLAELLRQHDGNIAAVARAVGKAPMQVRRWLRRYDLDADKFRK